jgi:AmiR/NasT family two-component response regulator
MKAALILEKDPVSTRKTAQILKTLGYLPAPVRSAEEALSVAKAISFDVIVTSTPVKPNDRRALTGELKRMAPEAAIVLIAESDEEGVEARRRSYAGLSAVLTRGMMADGLRRVVQFGIDGFGLQPSGLPKSVERRAKV